MAVVSQEVDLFQATIADNIALWAPSISRADVVKAAQLAQVHDIIERLPGGYDYEVQGRTGDLSVGERQLIAIARALAHPAPIVLLDEATASVDSLTEARVEQAIASLFRGRTVIVIAHRISTVAQADQIVVVHEGRVVEQGTHTSLLSKPGRYRVLVESGFSL